MRTCGDCKHFKWAKGLTGRKLRKMAGRCNGLLEKPGAFPIAFMEYDLPEEMNLRQVRPCYFDSQHASQCAAFEEKDCKPGRDGVCTRP